ncbi:hypothetical protein SDC9_160965 [bioreactor metagenome]|uniref:Uncharacterized protein n=1 Tax=bioreactor metagenome TaxID=1076179 RepID=A0A645FJD4_9ZZZZ
MHAVRQFRHRRLLLVEQHDERHAGGVTAGTERFDRRHVGDHDGTLRRLAGIAARQHAYLVFPASREFGTVLQFR